MSTNSQEVLDYRANTRYHSRIYKEKREKVMRAFTNLAKNGAIEKDARAEVCRLYGITDKSLDNMLAGRISQLPLRETTLTSEMLTGYYQGVIEAVDEADEVFDEIRAELEKAQADGTDFVTVEKKDTPKGIIEKHIPLLQAKLELVRKKVDIRNQMFEPLKAIVQRNVVPVDDTGHLASVSDDDLDREIAEQQRRLNVGS